ncbi:glutamate 5-kinase [Snodgrassella alvi]|uniref:glutamate 5-kinase n=1 Tax=Snodgrassella alvi TaxID=1196083 RepID=UPI000C1F2DD7|nr:glutamate 5-kinase [Snodgrassella alvi]PIT16184.1 glutamate 5-kinase [Snodgrassella alvi]PIT19251.1 glutamate 5-kinase [Snodgrassella alvi]
MDNSEFDIRQTECVVVKVGSSLVTNGGHGVDQNILNNWAQQIAQLRSRGIQVVLVSSGAIAEGMKRLGWQVRPKAINELQAAAAVGQMGLAQAYEIAFESLRIQTAQILLTHDDLSHRTRYLNARSTIRTLLEQGVVPIINENDSVTIDEIKLGDNDTLGALVTNLIEADILIILTDQDGLYDRDPRQHINARFIHKIAANHPGLESMAGGAGSSVGTGGMYTKVLAARRAALSGAATCIANGHADNVLLHLLNGNKVGTLFTPDDNRLNARQQWLLGQLQLVGKLTIDGGAVQALTMHNSSLLSIGCIDVAGRFDRGALVSVCNQTGTEIARGLINYNDREISRLLHQPSYMIEDILGYVAEEEVMHRDNMVLCRL